MLIVLRKESTPEDVRAAVRTLGRLGLEARETRIGGAVAFAARPGRDRSPPDADALLSIPQVERVLDGGRRNHDLADKGSRPEPTPIRWGAGAPPGELVVIAGPCAVEGEDDYLTLAKRLKGAGANAL